MCGIAGIVAPNHRAVIGPMTEALAHRGPDGAGFHEADGISLGQRRLAIIDIEGGKQPIGNEDGTLQLVCNGEIYNSPELREQLIRRGHRFRTKTDVEVILHLYEDHGADCVKHIRGMFAFAIWDAPRKQLLLARDHMGQKPMFFAHRPGRFAFASEVKGVLAAGLVQPELDLDALWHYISLRFIPDRHTLFRGIHKLPAAHRLIWTEGRIEIDRYWEPVFTTKLPNDERQVADGLDALLRETVKDHMLSDVRVGAFLSGGIDSSTVAAMMAGMSDAPIPSFSIGVNEASFNELPFARQVAERYGMERHERVVEPDIVRLLPRMIRAMDEPSDPFGLGVYLVSELASEHVKVALGGDGGDESFAGYDRFAGQRMMDVYAMMPAWFRRTVVQKVVDRIPESYGYKSIAQKARWANHMSFFDKGERYAESMSFLRFTQDAKQQLFTTAARARIDDPDSAQKILVHFNSANADDLVDRMLMTDLMTRMPDHLLVILDRMAMAHGLEGRSPLVDYRLVEYAASIPGELKLNGRKLKYILRKVAGRYLPPELITRKKQGFGFPLGIWMKGALSSLLRGTLGESRFVAMGLFERAYVDRLVEEHTAGRVDHSFRLWILLNLEIWYRMYFENESADSVGLGIDRLVAAHA